MEEKNVVFDIIIEFVEGIKKESDAVCSCVDGKAYKINGCRYLLGQILRQWETPNERWFLSIKAKELWEKLTCEDIKNYHYVKKVKCTCENPVMVKKYKSNGNQFKEELLHKGDSFKFNEVFHEEHIVPVNVIIKQLCGLEELNYTNVEAVLSNISVCRILKEEDKALSKGFKKNRPCDKDKVLDEVYKQVGIEIVGRK